MNKLFPDMFLLLPDLQTLSIIFHFLIFLLFCFFFYLIIIIYCLSMLFKVALNCILI